MLRLILLLAAGLLFWTSPLARVMGVDLLRSTADVLEPEDADKERIPDGNDLSLGTRF